jgi:hypothetical protein
MKFMNMHPKRTTGLIAIVIGVIVLILALYVRGRVAEAKGEVSKGSSMLPDNAIDRGITGALEGKLSAYDIPIVIGLIGGVVLIIVGAGIMYRYRR